MVLGVLGMATMISMTTMMMKRDLVGRRLETMSSMGPWTRPWTMTSMTMTMMKKRKRKRDGGRGRGWRSRWGRGRVW